MSIFLVSYDLIKEKKNAQHDYQILWDELKRLGAFRTQYSLWFVTLDNTAQEVVEHFQQFVDDNDRVSATKVFKSQYYYVSAIGGTNKWLADNPPEAR